MRLSTLAVAAVFCLLIIPSSCDVSEETDNHKTTKKAVAMSIRAVHKLVLTVLDRAIDGIHVANYTVADPSIVRSYRYLKTTDGDADAAVSLQYKRGHAIGRSVMTLALRSVPGIGTMAATSLPLWKHFREASLVAGLYGHDLKKPSVRNRILFSLVGKEIKELTFAGTARVAKAVVGQLFGTVAGRVLSSDIVKDRFKTLNSGSIFVELFRPGRKPVPKDRWIDAAPLRRSTYDYEEMLRKYLKKVVAPSPDDLSQMYNKSKTFVGRLGRSKAPEPTDEEYASEDDEVVGETTDELAGSSESEGGAEKEVGEPDMAPHLFVEDHDDEDDDEEDEEDEEREEEEAKLTEADELEKGEIPPSSGSPLLSRIRAKRDALLDATRHHRDVAVAAALEATSTVKAAVQRHTDTTDASQPHFRWVGAVVLVALVVVLAGFAISRWMGRRGDEPDPYAYTRHG